MNAADRVKYKELQAERRELLIRADRIEVAANRVWRAFTSDVCGKQLNCDGCPCKNICDVIDKADAKAQSLRKRLADIHKEMSRIHGSKEGK